MMTNDEIFLREITHADIKRINAWRADRSLLENLQQSFRYINIETDEEWFENYCQHRDQNIRLAICLKSNNSHIGNVYLLNIDNRVRSCDFHIFIADVKYRGKGFGKRASTQCIEHGFFDCNLNRIALNVLESNKNAIGLYKKIGFVQEGMLRQAAFKNGQFVNVMQMSLLREEYVKTFSEGSQLKYNFFRGIGKTSTGSSNNPGDKYEG